MKWNDHHQLEGKHAFLSASKFTWLNWDPETLEMRFYSQYQQEIGTLIHELAHRRIVCRRKINKNDVHLIEDIMDQNYIPRGAYDPSKILENLVPFINDAIGFRMDSEIILYYNQYCFGTTDAIVYDDKNKILRIHDYKNGVTPAHMEQLLIYAALYCLEYNKNPKDFVTELRLYQLSEIIVHQPKAEEIMTIMNIIKQQTLCIYGFTGGDIR